VASARKRPEFHGAEHTRHDSERHRKEPRQRRQLERRDGARSGATAPIPRPQHRPLNVVITGSLRPPPEQGRRDRQPEGPGVWVMMNSKLVACCTGMSRFHAFQDLVHKGGRGPKQVGIARPIRMNPPSSTSPGTGTSPATVVCGEIHDPSSVSEQRRSGKARRAIGARLGNRGERVLEIATRERRLAGCSVTRSALAATCVC